MIGQVNSWIMFMSLTSSTPKTWWSWCLRRPPPGCFSWTLAPLLVLLWYFEICLKALQGAPLGGPFRAPFRVFRPLWGPFRVPFWGPPFWAFSKEYFFEMLESWAKEPPGLEHHLDEGGEVAGWAGVVAGQAEGNVDVMDNFIDLGRLLELLVYYYYYLSSIVVGRLGGESAATRTGKSCFVFVFALRACVRACEAARGSCTRDFRVPELGPGVGKRAQGSRKEQ